MDPTAAVLKNAVTIRRFENTVGAEVDDTFRELARTLATDIRRRDPMAVSVGRRSRRLRSLLDGFDQPIADTIAGLRERFSTHLVDLGQMQGLFALTHLGRLIGNTIPLAKTAVVTRGELRSIIHQEPVRGATLGTWWQATRHRIRTMLGRELTIGVNQAEPIETLVFRIGGRRGVIDTVRRNSRHLTATAVNQFAARAQVQTYRRFEPITEEFVYTAILDARTTDTCMALDGRVFRYDDPAARYPPQHWGCRSIIVPVIKWRALGLPRPHDPLPTATSSAGRYAQWLRHQPHHVQEELLGRTRARLFRAGKLSLRDLVRGDGRSVRLVETQ